MLAASGRGSRSLRGDGKAEAPPPIDVKELHTKADDLDFVVEIIGRRDIDQGF